MVVPPASEVPVPPKPATDSSTDSAAAKRPDTIQPPFGKRPPLRLSDLGPDYDWNREEMFASGALTVADLIERVPGVTPFRSGWLASPKFTALNGDLGAVRIYYDGIEIDNLDPKGAPLLDLTTVELWTLERVQIERFGSELKVHLSSWRADHTDPYTRVDVFTGDEDTNIYRGFYGRRFGSGTGLQLAGQQYSTRAARLGGGGDALSFIGRAGIAKRNWSIDVFGLQRSAARALQLTFSTTDGLSIPAYDGTHTLVYARAAAGRQSGGPWAELVASYARFSDRSRHVTAAEAFSQRLVADTTDTTTSRFQYVATAGFARGAISAAVSNRLRAFEGEVYNSPEARVELAGTLGVVSFHGESDQLKRSRRGEVRGRITPLPFLAVAGAASVTSPFDDGEPDAPPGSAAARLEAGVRLLNPWLIGGYIVRDTAILAGPAMIDTAYKPVATGKRGGFYGGLRGKLFRDLNVDVVGTRWDSAGFYQPRYQSRSEINIVTRWLSRFPSGSFGLKAAFIHDYRSRVTFPAAGGNRSAPASSIMSGLLEIRILRGTASYQIRNIAGENYQLVPDFFMPRTINIYGIRWDFWN